MKAYEVFSMNLKLKTKPMKHQVRALNFLMARKFGALYTVMGSGKTKVLIDLINNTDAHNVLVVCPTKVCKVWIDEFEKHSYYDIPVYNLQEITNKSKVIAINNCKKYAGKQVFVINYETVWDAGVKNAIVKVGFDTIICDESHRIKGAGTKCSMALHYIGKRAERRYLMTGTPLAGSPLDVYAQYRFLDSSIFGTSYNDFKCRYANFIRRDGYDILDKRNPYKNLDELHEKMFSCAFSIDEKDIDMKLPEYSFNEVYFKMGDTIRLYYDKLKKDSCILFDDMSYIEASNILAACLRLQQLTSGFIKKERVKNGIRQSKCMMVSSERQDCLKEIIQNSCNGEPVVVFYRFRKDRNSIEKVAQKLGLNFYNICSGCNEKYEWDKDDKGVLAVQIQSGAEGIDMTHSCKCIYYSFHPSLALWEQSKKRIHRNGQTKECSYYVILAEGSIDVTMYNALKAKKYLVDYIMDKENFS